MQGPFYEEQISVVIIVETKNAAGNTARDRQYDFRGSDLLNSTYSPFVTFNITRSVTRQPSAVPTGE